MCTYQLYHNTDPWNIKLFILCFVFSQLTHFQEKEDLV